VIDPVDLFAALLGWLDPRVYAVQKFGPSKTQIGFALLFVAWGGLLLVGCGFAIPLITWLRWREHIRWFWRHGDDSVRGVLPMEYGAMGVVAISSWLSTGIVGSIDLVFAVLFSLWTPDPSQVPPPPAWEVTLLHVLTWSPAVALGLSNFPPTLVLWLALAALGYSVLCCRPRPPSERFSLTRWLQERQAPVPALLRI
jgi:hypothetical protein